MQRSGSRAKRTDRRVRGVLKLSAAIEQWQPSDRSALRDPLALLQAGWADIVGEEVAENSAPARIVDTTLVVVTRSSAWSHQLSFLAGTILEGVAARLPAVGIERLRFRFGTLPKRRSVPPPSQATPVVRRAGEPPTSATAREALGRFERHVADAQRAKRSAGWKECLGCAVLLEPLQTAYCAACSAAMREERALATARLLYEAPWLGFNGTAALVNGLQEKEYERIRSRVLKRWWTMLEQMRAAGRPSRDGRERLVASSYVLLRSKLPPEAIMPATVRNVLGDELTDLLYGDTHARAPRAQTIRNERRG
jgi:hypothetical protein